MLTRNRILDDNRRKELNYRQKKSLSVHLNLSKYATDYNAVFIDRQSGRLICRVHAYYSRGKQRISKICNVML